MALSSINDPRQPLELIRQTVNPKAELAERKATLKRAKAYLAEGLSHMKIWQPRSEECWSVYDNDQWKAKDKAILKSRGQAPITINETTRTIDLILGLQSVQPMDWIGRPMGEGDNDLSEVVSSSMKFVANASLSRHQFSMAYADSLVCGVGWIGIGERIRDPNPLAEDVQFMRIDWREIVPDPKQRQHDYSDARYVFRRVKTSLAQLQAFAKKHMKTIEDAQMEPVSLAKEQEEPGVVDNTGVPPISVWDEVDWNMAEKAIEWHKDDDPEGKEIWVNEMWERYSEPGILAWDPMGIKFEVDKDDPRALQVLADPARVARWDEVDFIRVRFHVFSGDILIVTNESPFRIDRLPYVPIWHKRDKHGHPLSVVEQMKDPQSEINHRRSRLLWGLLTRRGRVSSRLLQRMGITLEQAQEMMARPDALFEAEDGEIELLPSAELPQQQFELMQDARLAIWNAAGINQDMLGQQTSAKSGIAREIAASQGQLSLRPKENNLRLAHKIVGEIVWQLIQQYHDGPWAVRVTDDIGSNRFFVANQPDVDPITGMPHIANDLRQMRFDIEIDDSAWSPTMQQRASQVLLDLTGQIPDPMTRMKVMALALIAGDIPKKKQVLDIVKILLEPKDAIMPTPRPPTLALRMEDLTPDEQAQAVRRAGMQPDSTTRLAGKAPPVPPGDPGGMPPVIPPGMGPDIPGGLSLGGFE